MSTKRFVTKYVKGGKLTNLAACLMMNDAKQVAGTEDIFAADTGRFAGRYFEIRKDPKTMFGSTIKEVKEEYVADVIRMSQGKAPIYPEMMFKDQWKSAKEFL